MENVKIEPSKELSYWTGLIQCDGSLKSYNIRKNEKICEVIRLDLQVKNKKLIENFQKIIKLIFHRNPTIYQLSNGMWVCHINVKKLLPIFQSLDIKFCDPPTPPKWSLENPSYFGAYLAGIVDGDGDIRIKRKKYPQCVIRISSGSKQKKLALAIRKILGCAVSITRRYRKAYFAKENRFIEGVSFNLEFLVSTKNIEFIKQYVTPFINIFYKRKKLLDFIKKKCP